MHGKKYACFLSIFPPPLENAYSFFLLFRESQQDYNLMQGNSQDFFISDVEDKSTWRIEGGGTDRKQQLPLLLTVKWA